MKKNLLYVNLLCAISFVDVANAATINSSLTAENEIKTFNFDISTTGAFSFWTESGQNNFGQDVDTNMAIWSFDNSLSDWVLVDQNDDANGIFGSSNMLDSGLTFTNLSMGRYLLTITNGMNNPFGTYLSDGFNGNGANNSENIGNFTLHYTNATLIPTATPVPAAVWLFGSGLAGLIATRRKKASLAA